MVSIGIDIGSVSTDVVVMDDEDRILYDRYIRNFGKPIQASLNVLTELLQTYGSDAVARVAFTGTGGKLMARICGGVFVNEIIAQAKAVTTLYPEARTIMDIGGEDSKLIHLEKEGESVKIRDFSMNTLCAAGTGSFLDQQATRLGYKIEELGEIAMQSKNPPRIAGRCSVFAKTDMIHLQQIATPDKDILAGLCYALARNFKSSIGRGEKFRRPIVFQGGVAANPAMRKAFNDVLSLEEGELIIPEHFTAMGAIGSVIQARSEGLETGAPDLDAVRQYLSRVERDDKPLKPLSLSSLHDSQGTPKVSLSGKKKIQGYLGLDVGSISTNLVIIDENLNLVTKRYLMTAGKPIDAVRSGLKSIEEEVGNSVDILGVATTGSGRYLTGDFVGADIVRNEITAQATAAIHIDPKVDTVFEIGGQDSKFISIDDGVVVDFEMNKSCAAGTGSFLEEQAERLEISIKGEFSDLALSAKNPVRMGERCTVFIGSDLVHHQQKGARTDDLVAGLSYSIVLNYLNRVVGDRRIGNNIFFQGGTAFNKGVVAAFEGVLGRPITVPPNHDVTGAIGAAILAKEYKSQNPGPSNFKGFDLSKRPYTIKTFECKGCDNRCLIRQVSIENEQPLFYGSRCEKYDVVKKKKKVDLPNLFEERETHLLKAYDGDPEDPTDQRVIGIPRLLYFHEYFPFWLTFFKELGFKPMISAPTRRELIRKGVESIVAETCFPVKVAHGHVIDLLEKGVANLFLPSIIDQPPLVKDAVNSFNCPYSQTLPYTFPSAIDFSRFKTRLLKPVIRFGQGEKVLKRDLTSFGDMLGISRIKSLSAYKTAWQAQQDFYDKLIKRGDEILEMLEEKGDLGIVVVGRPYNTCDSGLNLNIPKKLLDLEVLPIPMDFLRLDDLPSSEGVRDIYWKYGQKILATARKLKDKDNLYAIYITNFGCGPDSFIMHFFREASKGKPYLQLEIDEHSADAGAITRCEAFLDSLKNVRKRKALLEKTQPQIIKTQKSLPSLTDRVIYIPHMADHAYAFAAAFEACGFKASVFPESSEETLEYGRKYTTGKECFPCIVTTGDIIRITKQPGFDAEKVAIFFPSGSGPCRYGQYNRFHRLLLDQLGYPNVPIFAPEQDETLYEDVAALGKKFRRLGWQGIVAVDLLYKMLHETRPYEVVKGSTDRVYKRCLAKICDDVRNERNLIDTFDAIIRDFNTIEVDRSERKPLIGIVGEIFVRLNRFSNEDVIRKVEALGGEAWLSPLSEWIYYTNFTARMRNTIKKKWLANLKLSIVEHFQKKDEKTLMDFLSQYLRNSHEPETEEIIEKASPYLHPTFEGEAILSVGKAIDLKDKGACGVINIMPFTCMPGTIVSAILKRFREENQHFPILNMAYDGQEQTNTLTRLEAFMHQSREYQQQQTIQSKGR